jgi:predicted ATPase
VLERHDELLGEAIRAHDGTIVKSEGDSVFAVFESALDAVVAAVAAQLALAAEDWGDTPAVKVRMGLHTGEGSLGGSDYVGIDVHRAARIMAAAHGGQVVISGETQELAESRLSPKAWLTDLGKHRLKDLSEPATIFQVNADGLATEFPPLRTLEAIPNNLPVQVTSFVGRERELARALELLGASRLLTLTGPGGTGKTRLALQVAAEISDDFEDGVYFVDLSPVSEVEVVATAILHAGGVAASSKDKTPEERLIEQLRPLQVLLVLDNFEHLLGAAAIVAAVIRGAPKSKVLVTSRAPLRIMGEQEMPVPPLVTGAGTDIEQALESEGVKLLVDRAMAVRPDFEVTESNAPALVELVERLDGLPLAIELVASRLRLLPIEAIVERLDTRMLGSGSVDLPERQQTIRNTIGWSYDLLDPPLQALFRRLSVFAGGAGLDELETYFEGWDPGVDLIDGLSRLADHSLLGVGETLGRPWFRMLHVIQEYAHEMLEDRGEAAQAHLAHLRVVAGLAAEAEPHLLSGERLHWFDVLEADHDNIRGALEWGVEHGETDLVLGLAASVWRFWQARGYLHEARRRLEAALALPGGDPRLRAKAMEALGGVEWWQGDMEACMATYQAALAMQRELGRSRDLALALYNCSLVATYHLGHHPDNDRLLDEAREIFLELGDEAGLGDIAWGFGNNRLIGGEYESALPYFLEAAEHYRAAGNEFGVGWSLFESADIKRRQELPLEGWSLQVEALRLFAGHRDVSGLVMVLQLMAITAWQLGDRKRSYRLAGTVDGLRSSSGVEIVKLDFNLFEGLDPESLASLSGPDLAVFEEGRTLGFDEAVAYGLAGPTDHDPEQGESPANQTNGPRRTTGLAGPGSGRRTGDQEEP